MVVELIKGKKFAKKDGSLVDVDQILKEKKVTFYLFLPSKYTILKPCAIINNKNDIKTLRNFKHWSLFSINNL